MGTIKMLDSSGHKGVEYDVAKPETISAAQALFDQALGAGYAVVDLTNGDGERVETFEPKTQKELVAVPQISGG